MGQIPHERIVSDPDIMMGKPTIKGTRITVELILTKLGEGMSMAELLEAYPHLTSDDVRAALSFAADYLRNEDIQFGQPERHEVSRRRMSRWSSGGGASTRRSRRLGLRDAWRGMGDRAILEGAIREHRALVTEDKGFGELVVRRGFRIPGLLLVRYAQSDIGAVLARLLAMVDRHGEALRQMYAVITPARVRLRRLDALRAKQP